MNDIYSLTNLKLGQTARVDKLISRGSIRRRFQDIGLIEGTKVKCVLKSPGNDPKAYQIRGAVIAIRNEDAEKILISNSN